MKRGKPIVGISLGDVSGIGPEVTAKALGRKDVQDALVPVVFGDGPTLARFAPFRVYDRRTDLHDRVKGPTLIEVTRLSDEERKPGRPTEAGGLAQYAFFEAAIIAAREELVDAICTAPVSKEQISRAGIPFMGHTEVLAESFGVDVLMLMDGPRVRVALATNHLPLADVPKAITVASIGRQLRLLHDSFVNVLGRAPKIAVCGVNPHAGEGGLLGREEVEVLVPAIEKARRGGLKVTGPLPADGLFAKAAGKFPFDVVLAMFHDQGLVAAKALDFELTVNVTLGLPVPRTSPDHGTAYDIAGKNQASEEPMVAALLKAAELAVAQASRARSSGRSKPGSKIGRRAARG
ncbi:MAG: 4-hydroxythreonine-4-phosphate dehydrogenase PdxA [Myxococcaceae bacterium]